MVDAVNLDDEPEMVAILLAIIEFERINEHALTRKTVHLITDEEVLGMINYLIKTREIHIDDVIMKLSQMKYFEMKEFFYEEIKKKIFKENEYI